jgi:hypothetical protein
MKHYEIVTFFTGLFGGSLDDKKLVKVLNDKAAEGWTLASTVQETKKTLIFFRRETVFLIFERNQ